MCVVFVVVRNSGFVTSSSLGPFLRIFMSSSLCLSSRTPGDCLIVSCMISRFASKARCGDPVRVCCLRCVVESGFVIVSWLLCLCSCRVPGYALYDFSMISRFESKASCGLLFRTDILLLAWMCALCVVAHYCFKFRLLLRT